MKKNIAFSIWCVTLPINMLTYSAAHDEQSNEITIELSSINISEQTSIQESSKEVAITGRGGGTFSVSLEGTAAPRGSSITSSSKKTSTISSKQAQFTDIIFTDIGNISTKKTIELQLPQEKGEENALGFSFSFNQKSQSVNIVCVRESKQTNFAARYTFYKKISSTSDTHKSAWQKIPYEITIPKSEAKKIKNKVITLSITLTPDGSVFWARGLESLNLIAATSTFPESAGDVES